MKGLLLSFITQNKGHFNADDLPQFESLMAKMKGPEPGQKYLSPSEDDIWAYGMNTVTHTDSQICPVVMNQENTPYRHLSIYLDIRFCLVSLCWH